jgi:hypothetical protein
MKIRFINSLLSASALVAFSVSAQQVDVKPANPVLLGESISISLHSLPANQDVKLSAERIVTEWASGKHVLYRAEATFAVGADGTLDLATAAPKSGSYKRADARGLFWSMVPVTGDVATDRKLLEVRLFAHTLANDKPITETVIRFADALANVKTQPVEKFPGALFAIQSDETRVKSKRPAIILLGGSEGGSAVTRGAACLLRLRRTRAAVLFAARMAQSKSGIAHTACGIC